MIEDLPSKHPLSRFSGDGGTGSLIPQFSRVVRAPHEVIGYHGCHRETARRVLARNPFIPSSNPYDWLGEGIYFWEYGPYRAWEWADIRFGENAAVLQARVTLGHCLNLLDTAYFQGVQMAYHTVEEHYRQENHLLPTNRSDKRHFLDRAIIEEYCQIWVESGGTPYQTVRGGFPEGDPVYAGSKILRETHIQIAVRDLACISDVELVV